MGRQIVCIAQFRLSENIKIPDDLSENMMKARGHGNYYLIARSSTCQASVESLKEAVIDEIKQFNPIFICGICRIELLDDMWLDHRKKTTWG